MAKVRWEGVRKPQVRPSGFHAKVGGEPRAESEISPMGGSAETASPPIRVIYIAALTVHQAFTRRSVGRECGNRKPAHQGFEIHDQMCAVQERQSPVHCPLDEWQRFNLVAANNSAQHPTVNMSELNTTTDTLCLVLADAHPNATTSKTETKIFESQSLQMSLVVGRHCCNLGQHYYH